MKRESEIKDCKERITDGSVEHLHVRKKAIVTEFTHDLEEALGRDCNLISISISEWEYDEVMTTLRWELQRELSTVRYYLSRVTSLGASIRTSFFQGGVRAGVEKSPDYSRTNKYLERVSAQTDGQLVLFINHHGEKPVDHFGWISKLGGLPENTTLVTHGFQRCERQNSAEFEVGQLREEQTVDYLLNQKQEISEVEAKEIHQVHDGNPVAIEIASEKNQLKKPLTGKELNELWSDVYDDKLTAEERDLLRGSSHLIDLHYRDVTMTVGKTAGECREILRSLESKGVVSEKESGLFTTDQYVKRYIKSQLKNKNLTENHRTSFNNYAEKWIDSHESQMQNMGTMGDEEAVHDYFPPNDADFGTTDPDLYLAIHHLSQIQSEIDRDVFIEELERIEAKRSGIFVFGLQAQRFFFENPIEIIQDLSESILGIEEEVKNELFSGTLDILTNFDLQHYATVLADGWTGDINTENLKSDNLSNPDRIVRHIQQGIDLDFYDKLPPEVQLSLARVTILAYTDSRTARDYYKKFGKTAQNYGLEEGPFCEFLEELKRLIDILSPEMESNDKQTEDPIAESYNSINGEIRDRVELQKKLEENRSEAQQEFQQRIEKIRSKPNEIVDQYIACGEELSKTSNRVFPFLWYALGHNLLSDILLNQKSPEIYGEYRHWEAKREEQEKRLSDEELVISMDEIEESLE